jgi:hypothetical protein
MATETAAAIQSFAAAEEVFVLFAGAVLTRPHSRYLTIASLISLGAVL